MSASPPRTGRASAAEGCSLIPDDHAARRSPRDPRRRRRSPPGPGRPQIVWTCRLRCLRPRCPRSVNGLLASRVRHRPTRCHTALPAHPEPLGLGRRGRLGVVRSPSPHRGLGRIFTTDGGHRLRDHRDPSSTHSLARRRLRIPRQAKILSRGGPRALPGATSLSNLAVRRLMAYRLHSSVRQLPRARPCALSGSPASQCTQQACGLPAGYAARLL